MSKFNDMLPERYIALCNRFDDIDRQIDLLWNGQHDCNCEFCEYEDDFDINEIEGKEKELLKERRLVEDTIRRIEIYAKDHDIKFQERKK